MGRKPKATMEVKSETGVTLKTSSFGRPEAALAQKDELKNNAMSILGQAKAIVITTHEQSMAAADFLKGIKALKKLVDEKIGPLVESARNNWKLQVAFKKDHDEPLSQAEMMVKGKMQTYLAEQEHLRRVEEQRLQAEAQKAAEEQAEQDALLMEATGDAEAAEVVRDEPVRAPVVTVAPVAKPSGIAMQSVWRYRIIDANSVPREYLAIDDKKLGAVVRAMKAACNIPGVEIFEEKIVKTF